MIIRLFFLLIMLLLATEAVANFSLPSLPPREEFGNLLLDRTSTANGQKGVSFSHWLHREKFTCRVCHSELEFQMKSGATEITERANRSGKFCGACHNGKIAFRHNGNCEKCHNGDINFSNKRFDELLNSKSLPTIMTGNGINWSEALERKLIKPSTYIKKKSQDMKFDKELLLEAEMTMIPPAIFPHKSHTAWLDCDSCHPELFNIKRKGTHFSMVEILKGNYCGICHMTIAFPMNECKRCHPAMRDTQ